MSKICTLDLWLCYIIWQRDFEVGMRLLCTSNSLTRWEPSMVVHTGNPIMPRGRDKVLVSTHGMQGRFQLHTEFEDSLGSRRSCVKQIKRNSQMLKAILWFKMTHFNYVNLRGVMYSGVGSRRFELLQNQFIWETWGKNVKELSEAKMGSQLSTNQNSRWAQGYQLARSKDGLPDVN